MPRAHLRLMDPALVPPIIVLPPARYDAPDVPDPPPPIILSHHHRPGRAERHAWRRFFRHLIRAL